MLAASMCIEVAVATMRKARNLITDGEFHTSWMAEITSDPWKVSPYFWVDREWDSTCQFPMNPQFSSIFQFSDVSEIMSLTITALLSTHVLFRCILIVSGVPVNIDGNPMQSNITLCYPWLHQLPGGLHDIPMDCQPYLDVVRILSPSFGHQDLL